MPKLLNNWVACVDGTYVSISDQIVDLMTDNNAGLFDNQDSLEFYLAEQVADNLNTSDFGTK
jgi:hypothetical protein